MATQTGVASNCIHSLTRLAHPRKNSFTFHIVVSCLHPSNGWGNTTDCILILCTGATIIAQVSAQLAPSLVACWLSRAFATSAVGMTIEIGRRDVRVEICFSTIMHIVLQWFAFVALDALWCISMDFWSARVVCVCCMCSFMEGASNHTHIFPLQAVSAVVG